MIKIMAKSSRKCEAAPKEHFSGDVYIEQMFPENETTQVFGINVIFEPKSRTHWHSHPLGQTLIVTSGVGLIQFKGGPVRQILPGDVVWISANLEHWHGASESSSMTHIAIQEMQDGNALDWFEEVTDDEYSCKVES